MTATTPIWSYRVSLDDVPESGAHFTIEADNGARDELARALGLRELPRLSASFDVTRRGGGGLHVVGEVNAIVGQNCVVTLEPIENELNEAIDLIFAPDTPSIADERGEATIEFSDDEPPEAMIGGEIDLGVVATEFLLLGIDPYPRKEGATFEPRVAGDPESHPFAALGSLRKKKGDG